jgi:hypothetical protein
VTKAIGDDFTVSILNVKSRPAQLVVFSLFQFNVCYFTHEFLTIWKIKTHNLVNLICYIDLEKMSFQLDEFFSFLMSAHMLSMDSEKKADDGGEYCNLIYEMTVSSGTYRVFFQLSSGCSPTDSTRSGRPRSSTLRASPSHKSVKKRSRPGQRCCKGLLDSGFQTKCGKRITPGRGLKCLAQCYFRLSISR